MFIIEPCILYDIKYVKSVPKKLGISSVFQLAQRRKDAKNNTKVLWEVIKRTLYDTNKQKNRVLINTPLINNYKIESLFPKLQSTQRACKLSIWFEPPLEKGII